MLKKSQLSYLLLNKGKKKILVANEESGINICLCSWFISHIAAGSHSNGPFLLVPNVKGSLK